MKFKMRFAEVEITLRERANIVTTRVPVWEAAVLEAVHNKDGLENVRIIREVVDERENPNSGIEFDRLHTVYREDLETGISFVDQVFGAKGIGRANLKRAMQEAVLPPNTPVTPYEKEPEIRSDLLAAIARDVATEATDLIGEAVAEDEEPAPEEAAVG